jgi:hypothetical protein
LLINHALIYTRESAIEKLLVVLNFTANTAQLNADLKLEKLTRSLQLEHTT